MARDMVQLMEALGYPRFLVAGHDRGGRVAYRMALEYPQRVERVALFDVIPTSEMFERADARFAMGFWPWSLLAQPAPLPERLIAGDPAALVDHALSEWGSEPASFPPYVREAYIEALRDPASVHAICEEYRAAASCDFERDRADRSAGRRIQCPTLVLWSKASPLEDWYEEDDGPLGIWKRWANEVSGRAIAGGHFFPEQNAAETLMELRAFFR
jgi:haloacetate dehalogenase